MRIAILGMARVGSALGRRWVEAGHPVVFGVRDPAKRKAGAGKIGAEVTTVPGAAASAPVVLLAVPWAAVPGVVKAAGELCGRRRGRADRTA